MAHGAARQGRQHSRGDSDAGGGAVLGHRTLRKVDMNVLGLIEIRGNAQLGGTAPQAGIGRLYGLLHHLAQIAGELQLAGAVHHTGLHL